LERLADLLRGRLADPVDVGEADLEPLAVREVDAGDTCHSVVLLALPLLVPGIGADHHGAPVPLDHTTALAHGLHRGTDFHEGSWDLPETEGDAAAREVVRGELHLDAITGEDADVVLAHLPGDGREDAVTAL